MRRTICRWRNRACTLTMICCAVVAPLASAQTFRQHPKQFRVGPNPSAIAAADLDGDGLPEIVTADIGELTSPREEKPANEELSYLHADGPLTYTSQTPLRAGFAPYAIVVANIDALKAPDLVVASFHTKRERDLTLFRNLGNNLFEPQHFNAPGDKLTYARMRDGDGEPVFTAPGLTAVAVHDFNHDGFRDALTAGWACDALIYFPGDAETYFAEAQVTPAAGGPRDIALADFDRDGERDVAVTLYSADEVGLWRGDGKGQFESVTRFPSRGRLPHRIAKSDFNGDGKSDIAVSHCHSDDSIVIFFGDGGFSFSLSQEILLGQDREKIEHEIRDMAVDDFNGDGRPDIAAACYSSGIVVVLINESGEGTTAVKFRKETYRYDKARPRALCVADFNGDGSKDLGVCLWESNAVGLLLGGK